MPKFRTAYDRDLVEGITFDEPSMAQQHFKDECDVNNILRKYEQLGLVLMWRTVRRLTAIFSSVLEFQQAQNLNLKHRTLLTLSQPLCVNALTMTPLLC